MRIKLRRTFTVILAAAICLVVISNFLHSVTHYENLPVYNHAYVLNHGAAGKSPRGASWFGRGKTGARVLSYVASLRGLFWFDSGSDAEPEPPRVWPNGLRESDDRILAQLKHIPEDVKENRSTTKTIMVYTGLGNYPAGHRWFRDNKCAVDSCYLTDNRDMLPTADAVLFQNAISMSPYKKPPHQVWIVFFLESPHHTPNLQRFHDLINWTATYRVDSTIVTPYEKFVPYDNFTSLPEKPTRNYATGKHKKVAWFVSNCMTKNNRYEYVRQLKEYIDVDIYGSCGFLSCPRSRASECYKLLSQQYKFYLSFENSNCKDYITEKFFWNGLSNNIVPVVMGARPEDYAKVAPPGSYIHVDDFESPRELAVYLHKLDQNDELYNQYFRWKGMGEFINTKFYCRLCAMLHDESRLTWYTDIHQWWAGPDVCVESTPKNPWASWRTYFETKNITCAKNTGNCNEQKTQLLKYIHLNNTMTERALT